MTLLLIAVALLGPLVAIAVEARALRWLNPVIACYAMGVVIALIGLPPEGAKMAKTLAEASIPLAIPLLLFSTDLASLRRLSRPTLLGFGLAVVSVGVAAAAGSILFGHVEQSERIAGMLVGVYTGGTPNMVAIGQALEVPEETFLLLNASDLLLGATYLLFLLTAAKPLLSRVFRDFPDTQDEVDVDDPSSETPLRKEVVGGVLGLVASGLILAISAGLTVLVVGEMHVAGVILGITAGGILASLVGPIRRLKGTNALGNYLILVFCVAIGAQTDLESLVAASSTVFLYCATVMGAAIVIHLALCRVARLDVDTTIMTSTAAVYGPPFVPLVARAIGNRALIVPGLAVGILGYAAGNFLGVALAWGLGVGP